MGINTKNLPEHLYSFLPKECLEKGVRLGGWDKKQGVVPAFDPEVKNPELIKRGFGFGNERILVEVVGEGKNKFMPRRTGPQNSFQGIYCSYDPVDCSYLKPVNY